MIQHNSIIAQTVTPLTYWACKGLGLLCKMEVNVVHNCLLLLQIYNHSFYFPKKNLAQVVGVEPTQSKTTVLEAAYLTNECTCVCEK